MNDICNFIPPKQSSGNLEFYHFVYETNLKKLHQPFMQTNYYIYLVFKGEGILKTKNKEYRLTPSTLFFIKPRQEYEITDINNFSCIYISFNGAGAASLLENNGINAKKFVFYGHEQLLNFWMTSVCRINSDNANILTESVLLYSLSFLNEKSRVDKKNPDRFDSVLEYVNRNFTDSNLTIAKLSDMFFYSSKYMSSLFLKKTNTKFREYLNNLRINHAISIINDCDSVLSLSTLCGFSDSFYFSKVFKKVTGMSPSEYKKEMTVQQKL